MDETQRQNIYIDKNLKETVEIKKIYININFKDVCLNNYLSI